jgi:AraC-like DNA-binding protein
MARKDRIRPKRLKDRIVTLVADAASHDRLCQMFGRSVDLVRCREPFEARAELSESRAVALIASVRIDRGRSTLPFLRRVRQEFRVVPIILYAPLERYEMRLMLQAGRYGVGDLVIEGYDDSPGYAAGILKALQLHSVSASLKRAVGEVQDPEVRMLCEVLFDEPGQLNVGDLARVVGKTRERVRQQFRAAGLAPPHTVLQWSRITHAVRLCADPGRSVSDAALDLGFPSPAALRLAVKRCTGMSLRQVMYGGGTEMLLERFTALVRKSSRRREISATS